MMMSISFLLFISATVSGRVGTARVNSLTDKQLEGGAGWGLQKRKSLRDLSLCNEIRASTNLLHSAELYSQP